MAMDLQTQRRLEDFLHLLEIHSYTLAAYMEFMDPPFRLCIEVCANHCTLTLTLPLDPLSKENALLTLLPSCQPEYFQGTPVRCFTLPAGVAMSFNISSETPTQSWYALYLSVKKILSTAKKIKRL